MCSAAAARSSGICPLDTARVMAGTAWRKCAVLFCHGPAWKRKTGWTCTWESTVPVLKTSHNVGASAVQKLLDFFIAQKAIW